MPHVGGGGSRKNTHVVFPLRRTQCLILPLFHRPLFHYSISGRVGRLKEEVKEVKSSHSEVLSEKKKLQEQLGILQKVGCVFFFLSFFPAENITSIPASRVSDGAGEEQPGDRLDVQAEDSAAEYGAGGAGAQGHQSQADGSKQDRPFHRGGHL